MILIYSMSTYRRWIYSLTDFQKISLFIMSDKNYALRNILTKARRITDVVIHFSC